MDQKGTLWMKRPKLWKIKNTSPEDTDYCECCACKNIECKCVKKCKCAFKLSCKGIQKAGNNINYKKFHDVLFNKHSDQVSNKGFRYVDGYMKSNEQNNKRWSLICIS